MSDDADIILAAKLIIDQHGKGAAEFAEQQSLTLVEECDIDGAITWNRILAAIDDLQHGGRAHEAAN